MNVRKTNKQTSKKQKRNNTNKKQTNRTTKKALQQLLERPFILTFMREFYKLLSHSGGIFTHTHSFIYLQHSPCLVLQKPSFFKLKLFYTDYYKYLDCEKEV